MSQPGAQDRCQGWMERGCPPEATLHSPGHLSAATLATGRILWLHCRGTPCQSADCRVRAAAVCSISAAGAPVLQFPGRNATEPRQTARHKVPEFQSVLFLLPLSISYMRSIYLCAASSREAVCMHAAASNLAA